MKGTLKAVISQNNIKHPFTIMYSKDNTHTERKVFNLITKKKYWRKPTYDTITETIKQMAKMCKEYDIKYLALPRIGSGLDKLNWNKIKEIIQEEFKDFDIEILICYI